LLASLVVLAALSGFLVARGVADALRYSTSVARMGQLLSLFRSYAGEGAVWEAETFRRLSNLSREPELQLVDGWGRPFVYATDPDLGRTIRSLGSDGLRGSCCTRWVDNDFREDLVYSLDHGTLQDIRHRWGPSGAAFALSIVAGIAVLASGAMTGPRVRPGDQVPDGRASP
jgi:hypothetical protein